MHRIERNGKSELEQKLLAPARRDNDIKTDFVSLLFLLSLLLLLLLLLVKKQLHHDVIKNKISRQSHSDFIYRVKSTLLNYPV